DPDARAGDEGTEILAAAEGTSPPGALGLADTAVAALDRGDPLLELFLDAGGLDAEVAQDAAGGRTRVQGDAEQQVLGAELGLAAAGGQPPRAGDGLSGLAVTGHAALMPVLAGHHRGLEPAGVGLPD